MYRNNGMHRALCENYKSRFMLAISLQELSYYNYKWQLIRWRNFQLHDTNINIGLFLNVRLHCVFV